MGAPMKLDLRYLYEDVSAWGQVRLYAWRGKGHRKVRIRSAPGTAEFMREYEQALALSQLPPAAPTNDPRKLPVPGTWRHLCVSYMQTPEFKALDPRTQRVRRTILEHTFDEKIAPDSSRVYADVPVSEMTPDAVFVLRDRKAHVPEGANNRLKAIKRVFRWALERRVPGVRYNPAADVAYLKRVTRGFRPWTPEDVQKFEQCHAIGSQARLALALYLFTGVRKSDVVRLGKQHVTREGWLKFTTHKGRNRHPVVVELPIIAPLRMVLDQSPTGSMTYLVTQAGCPFTANGFGNKFRQWCNKAGLPGLSAHGLRKLAASTAAERGASVNELMALFGWLSEKQAVHYTRAADRKKLSSAASKLLGGHGS
jgi:integrase